MSADDCIHAKSLSERRNDLVIRAFRQIQVPILSLKIILRKTVRLRKTVFLTFVNPCLFLITLVIMLKELVRKIIRFSPAVHIHMVTAFLSACVKRAVQAVRKQTEKRKVFSNRRVLKILFEIFGAHQMLRSQYAPFPCEQIKLFLVPIQ